MLYEKVSRNILIRKDYDSTGTSSANYYITWLPCCGSGMISFRIRLIFIADHISGSATLIGYRKGGGIMVLTKKWGIYLSGTFAAHGRSRGVF
jgi:hypothetical protein